VVVARATVAVMKAQAMVVVTKAQAIKPSKGANYWES
jgi:hypothetical protein